MAYSKAMIGFIYIMSNPSLPGQLKIGKTSKDPQLRLRRLSNTSVPTKFSLDYFALVDDFDYVETQVHVMLSASRVDESRRAPVTMMAPPPSWL
ncbi:MAG: GIY-YIG nuclease family protein [Gammaproteobacteria bacterium]|nr:GIY-YIG nuclease family protein [Gammaproteobacteria bacterium]